MKKLVALLTSLLLMVSVLSSCSEKSDEEKDVPSSNAGTEGEPEKKETSLNFNETGLPILKEKETFEIMISMSALSKKTMEEKDIFDKLEEETNVQIEWIEVISSGWTEKVNLAINSGDLPDGIMGSFSMAEPVGLGLIEPLNDYMEYAPNLQKIYDVIPVAKVATSYIEDGKNYYYPGVNPKDFSKVEQPIYINQEWLDTLGLDMPTTTDEFKTVLEAFKTGDPNGNGIADEIPLGMGVYWGGYEISQFFGAWDMMDFRSPLKYASHTVRDGVLDFNPVNPNFREALEYFNELHEEGLIDPEAMTQDTVTKNAKAQSNPAVYGVFMGWTASTGSTPETVDQYVPLLPLKGPDGAQKFAINANTVELSNGLAIFTTCESPEVLVRWIDHMNSEEYVHEIHAGEQGIAWDINPDNNEYFEKDISHLGVDLTTYKCTEGLQNGPTCRHPDFTGNEVTLVEGSMNEEKTTISELYSPYLFDEYYASNYMPIMQSTPESKEIQILATDLSAHVEAFMAAAVLGGITDKQWEEFKAQCVNLEYEKITTYYQARYDSASN